MSVDRVDGAMDVERIDGKWCELRDSVWETEKEKRTFPWYV